jgi:SAM-dependent methyltransferase
MSDLGRFGRQSLDSDGGLGPMTFAERLLLLLSRTPGGDDYAESLTSYDEAESSGSTSPLWLLQTVFPGFLGMISGKSVLDFGCGNGYQSVALATAGARQVLGVDTNLDALIRGRALADRSGVASIVQFSEEVPQELLGSFDVVISQNSMEHFSKPSETVGVMLRAMNANGDLLITFGPPWFSPRGSHMHFFTKVPWVNLVFSEKTVMTVRSRFRNDGAQRYEDVESGLNKMSLARFESLIREMHVFPTYRRYECVKGLNGFARIPLLREMLVNRVSVILRR